MLEKYIDMRLQKKSLDLIYKVQGIVKEYMAQGYSLTVRQVFYQLVSRDLLPNTEKSYNEIIRACKSGRLMGIINWDAITDRSCSIDKLASWSSPKELLSAAAKQYRRDWWENQSHYIECWVEKQALADVVKSAAWKYGVTSFACKGYPSITAMYDTAERMKAHSKQQCTILYLGDFDPSGMDMVDNIIKQMATFGANVAVERIALNMEQIFQYDPPPNPAKTRDTRYKRYEQNHGVYSWELDALPPDVLIGLITDNILLRLDKETLKKTQAIEEQERRAIQNISAEIDLAT